VNPISGDCFASSAIRCCRVDTRSGFNAPAMFPSNGSMTWHPLPSPGSRRLRFPCFVGTTRCSDVQLSIPPRLVAFAWRYHGCTRVSFPTLSSAPARAWSWSAGAPPAFTAETEGPPRFLGNPCVPMPCSPTPAGPSTPGHYGVPAWPPLCPQRRLPRDSSFRGSIARLWDSLFTLRPMQLPTPDAKLASGRWPSATGRDWLPVGFQ
jgi:hypothetical protein